MRSKKSLLWPIMSVMMVLALVLAACASPAPAPTQAPAEPTKASEAEANKPAAPAGAIDCMGAKAGDSISMLYQWSGAEEEKLNQVLAPFVKACGVTVNAESSRDQALLDTRVKGGTPPDVTFWQTTQLAQYKDQLKSAEALGVKLDNYADFWKSMGTIDGKMMGLPVKADIKTIIWYSPKAFEAAGYQVPATWDELNALVEKMVAEGKIPWSMGMESGDATGWTGTDFIQDILLVKKGPQYVKDLISGKVAYNDAGVKEAYEIYGKWAMGDKYTIGGAKGTVSTGFNDAILKVFGPSPEAMMVKQSGFAQGTILGTYADLKYGTDFDFFGIPGAQGLQGGSDWMMAFSDKPAVKALFAYIASEEGGKAWAAAGFDLTPNKAGASAYADPALAKRAEILNSAKDFTPDLGDSIPGGFGSAEFKELTNYVNGGDLDQALKTVADVQATALKK
ncbi:MAG: extracellular solute-binding protein [Anaerolineaceae bacterium]|nr:extracellular solute-binding protein [Anaerolineaceae bacterium]